MRLAAAVNHRMIADPLVASSGCVVNTMGGVDGSAYTSLLATIKALEADVVRTDETERHRLSQGEPYMGEKRGGGGGVTQFLVQC